MEHASSPLNLLQDFPPTDNETWRKEAEALLKGAPFDKKMLTPTYEGITLQPIYRADDVVDLPHLKALPGEAPYLRGTEAGGHRAQAWQIAQEISLPTPEAFNGTILEALNRGQNAVNLVVDAATAQGLDPAEAEAEQVGKNGVSIACLKDLSKALESVDLTAVPIHIQTLNAPGTLLALLIAEAQRQGLELSKLKGSVTRDPLNLLAMTGELPVSLEGMYDGMAEIEKWMLAQNSGISTIGVSAMAVHESGGNAVQELAYALAAGVEYLRAMVQRRLSVDQVAPRIRFTLGCGPQFFMEIAKFRALRVLWSQAVEAFGGSQKARKVQLHVRTGRYAATRMDPYVNLLRVTTEAFSAVVGGCDSLHAATFDETVRPIDEISRRLARNTQIILKEESHLDSIIDPAGGSWYVEKLTDELAKQAWSLFQEIEKQGGLAQALLAGTFQKQVAEIAGKRAKALAQRKDVLLGTNQYPNLGETPLDLKAVDHDELKARRMAETPMADAPALRDVSEKGFEALVEAAAQGATLGQLVKALRSGKGEGLTCEAFRLHRLAEPFEALRAEAEAILASTGSRPKVFLANMGRLSQHKGRADFSIGFFEVGGFEMVNPKGFETPEAAAEAAAASGARIVVLCSTDDTYPELVPPFVKALKSAQPDTIAVLAGYPEDQIEAHKAAGIDLFIHVRANVLETLQKLMHQIGAK